MASQSDRTKKSLEVVIGENWDSLISDLNKSVLIRLSESALKSVNGQWISVFVFNLIIRLFPIVSHVILQCPSDSICLNRIPKYRGSSILRVLKNLYSTINPQTRLTVTSSVSTINFHCHITVGAGPLLKQPGIWVGSNGWISRISSLGSQKIGSNTNPVGAHVSAILAISETWKLILLPLQNRIKTIQISPVIGSMVFSSFDYTLNKEYHNPEIPDEVDISRLLMIGLGAGGGAAAYTLACLKKIHGVVTLVDPDEIELSNLNRYVYATIRDAVENRVKVECISSLFNESKNLKIKAFHSPYFEAKKYVDTKDYRLVAAAVDNRKARREIQYHTPKTIIDAAATSQGDFFIWNMELGKTECMFCKHPLGQKDAEQIQAMQLSRLLGLNPYEWISLISNNDAFKEKQISIIHYNTRMLRLNIGLPHEGQRFQSWFKMNCGRLKLPEVDGEIPIPFAPVMAGVLQAGEILKVQLFPKFALKGYYWNTLTARFNSFIRPRIKPPNKLCPFCNDKVYIRQYNRKWMIDNGTN